MNTKHIKLYEAFIFEYHNEMSNVWKVAASKTPIEGPAVFTDAGKTIKEATEKLEKNFKSYEETYDKILKETKEIFKEMSKETFKDGKQKYSEESIAKREKEAIKPLELAMKVLKDSKKFMDDFNSLYDKLKDDLCGTDHVKVAKAIMEFKDKDMYPYELTKNMGTLKSFNIQDKEIKKFVNFAIQWPEEIVRNYKGMVEQGKLLGKTEKQIAGRQKSSLAMKMRWGGF